MTRIFSPRKFSLHFHKLCDTANINRTFKQMENSYSIHKSRYTIVFIKNVHNFCIGDAVCYQHGLSDDNKTEPFPANENANFMDLNVPR